MARTTHYVDIAYPGRHGKVILRTTERQREKKWYTVQFSILLGNTAQADRASRKAGFGNFLWSGVVAGDLPSPRRREVFYLRQVSATLPRTEFEIGVMSGLATNRTTQRKRVSVCGSELPRSVIGEKPCAGTGVLSLVHFL